jgi:nucleotide-binding universal stress UspA family protein
MSLTSLLVSVQPGRSNRPVLDVARDLAGRFGCGIIGVAACRPIESICFDYSIPAKLFEEDRKQVAREFQAAEAEFRAIFASCTNRLEWHPCTTMSSLAGHLASQVHRADLIVVGAYGGGAAASDRTRQIDLCDLVMQAGRPVLVVPKTQANGRLDHVVVGWKDTRESRRAIADALPLLARAREVTLAAIAPEAELPAIRLQLKQLAEWLGYHGVAAQQKAIAARGSHAHDLGVVARDCGADLLVAGAYGHSRHGEWVLGGITSELLERTDHCTLLSH